MSCTLGGERVDEALRKVKLLLALLNLIDSVLLGLESDVERGLELRELCLELVDAGRDLVQGGGRVLEALVGRSQSLLLGFHTLQKKIKMLST